MSKAIVLGFMKVKRTRKKIIQHYSKGDEDFNVGSTENALPEFQTTMDALLPMFISRAGLPESYAENARVAAVFWTDQAGARKISGEIHKHLPECSGPVVIRTAWDFIENPTETGTYTPPLSPEHAALVEAFTDAARDYALGKRAQGELPGIGLVKDEPEEEEGGGEQGELPGAETSKKSRKRKPGPQNRDDHP